MQYYQPTSFLQKIRKLLQLFRLFFQARTHAALWQPGPTTSSVLMVVPQLDRMGGYEKQAVQLAGSLTLSGNFITILSDQTGNFPRKEFRNGFLIYRISSHGSRSKWNLLFSTLMFFCKKRRSFQIVHCHGITGLSIFAARVGRWLGRPAVLKPATKDDISSIFSLNSLKHRTYRRWLNKMEFVAISEELKREMQASGIQESRIHVISNFVNTSKFEVVTEDRRMALRTRFSAADRDIFLFLGRLEKRKGVDLLLRAWKECSPGLLWIVGTGQEEQTLQKLSSDLELRNIHFHGPTQTPLDYYQAADVFVFPSLKEGSPNVVLEAMSCGLPCIATRIGGIVDLIRHECEGYLVEPGSVAALAEAIKQAGARPEDRKKWADQAAKTARERFDISRITALYVDLYSEMLAR